MRNRSDFATLREQGRRCTGRFVVLNALDRPRQARKFGVVTARSLGSAVTRNHARRWLREIYRKHKHQLKPNFSIVVVARQALSRASYHDLQTELLDLFAKAGALTPL